MGGMGTDVVTEPEARLSEGWCPHPEHDQLTPREADGRGYCAACEGYWSAHPDRPWLIFRVESTTHFLERFVDVCFLTKSALGAAGAIQHTAEKTHRIFRRGPSRG